MASTEQERQGQGAARGRQAPQRQGGPQGQASQRQGQSRPQGQGRNAAGARRAAGGSAAGGSAGARRAAGARSAGAPGQSRPQGQASQRQGGSQGQASQRQGGTQGQASNGPGQGAARGQQASNRPGQNTAGAQGAAEGRQAGAPETQMIVSGFLFTDEEIAKQAEKEAEGIVYIRQKVDMDEPLMVLQVYNKMVEQKLFETEVGYSYLKELWDYLYSIPFIRREEILPIPTDHPILEANARRNARRIYGRRQGQGEKQVVNVDYKVRFFVMLVICIVLVFCIGAMFAITATSGNATILNYEQQLINRYETWEQELNEREEAVSERERELGIRE